MDAAWRYTYVHRHTAAIMGVTPEALLGRVLWKCFPEALGTALDAEYRHVMAAREVRRGDGTRGFVGYTSTLVRGGHRDPSLAVVIGVDVIELRELNEALEARVARRTGELRARNKELAAKTAALAAFASFTELVGRETDLGVLTQAAASALHQALGDGSTGYYELEDGRWKQRVWDGDEEGTLDAAQVGFPQDVPLFAQPAATREAHFVAGWRAREDDLARHTPEYGAVAVYPVVVGRVLGQLAAALRRRWPRLTESLVV